ncbi:hypothetical protein SAMN05192551_10739 [Tindallia magadiensis]|uniref:Uncharacterized protein n=1 Tax=Tindallia magadiensis TaxID=69895 RepID=A0A1I3FTZ4_9FIRM|nr:hypothetical protein [Tindallia magadiensis]SFI14738.1 hypothetical protein SAMN05192551_10739 [Tindallia magadiensis]
MGLNQFWVVPLVIVFIILISIQYALNRVVHLLKEIKDILNQDKNQPPYM